MKKNLYIKLEVLFIIRLKNKTYKMKLIKCITFDFELQRRLPEEIKVKMKADREKAKKEQQSNVKSMKNDNPVCNSVRHKMMLAGIYKECPVCGEKFKEK